MGLFSLKWWRYTGEMRTFPLMVNVMSTPWFPPGRTECRECEKTHGEGESRGSFRCGDSETRRCFATQ